MRKKGYLSSVNFMAMSPNGRILATTSYGIHLYDTTISTWKIRHEEIGLIKNIK